MQYSFPRLITVSLLSGVTICKKTGDLPELFFKIFWILAISWAVILLIEHFT